MGRRHNVRVSVCYVMNRLHDATVASCHSRPAGLSSCRVTDRSHHAAVTSGHA